MKPPIVPLDKVSELAPACLRMTVPETYRDENGHMNMRWYLAIYDDAGYPLQERLGLSQEYHAQHGTGGFDLEHHIHYLREVLPGDEVSVYARLVQRTGKRIHYLMFLVNETRGTLASIFECVNSFADMRARRTAPYPPDIAARIDAVIARHASLEWPAPVCGVMRA
jgi:acyl-CoA thioester hydrolase